MMSPHVGLHTDATARPTSARRATASVVIVTAIVGTLTAGIAPAPALSRHQRPAARATAAATKAPPTTAVRSSGTIPPATAGATTPTAVLTEKARRSMVVDFDFMTPAKAADRISPYVIVNAAQFTDERGKPVDEVMSFNEQRSGAIITWVLTSEPATGEASYGGYRVLMKASSTNKAWMFGSGASAPLMGNAVDAFTSITTQYWMSSAFTSATGTPAKLTTSTAPRRAFRTATKKVGTVGTTATVQKTPEKLLLLGSSVVVTRYPKSAPTASMEMRWQAYAPNGTKLGTEGVAHPNGGAITPYSDPGQIARECQALAQDAGDAAFNQFIAAGAAISVPFLGLAAVSATSVVAAPYGVAAGLSAAAVFLVGSAVLAFAAKEVESRNAYNACIRTADLGIADPGRIPPYRPPDGGPDTGTPTEICDKTGVVSGTGGDAPRAQPSKKADGTADDVSEEIVVDGTRVTVCVVSHIEYV